jgi:2-deoxy-D-gluconate 3-dehydrogenase
VPLSDLFSLAGRRAVVTGGAGLLGAVFVETLAQQGAHVVAVDTDAAKLARVVDGLDQGSGEIEGAECDITDEDAVGRLFAGLSTVDVLVNSAAIDPKFDSTGDRVRLGHLTTYAVESWRRSLEVNLTGTFLVTQAACRIMESQHRTGKGSIVNISSTYGLTGPDQRIYAPNDGAQQFFKPVDYSTTKAGILGFTRAVAALYRDTEIRVNALSPGGAFHDHDDEFVEHYSARTILGRMAAPDDYRGALAFLASDASAYMTGANLVVDGGWTAL